ncbi:MAG TPA: methionyl-tRNA formyltransferase [Candidatus Acidoferrum sp.]|nr:methionyl-tRNA formyltransferase [Candidatus Acidoferrum sp.]
MRILFMGTPEFAALSLSALLAAGHEVTGVVTQPDKPVGRKQVLTPPPVKALALEKGLPVWQPETLKGRAIEGLLTDLDAVAVVAYGRILPRYVLEAPRCGCINVHGSLLPKLRGAAPIQRSIINGDALTGVTTMVMDAGMDTGDMILSKAVEIGEYETSDELFSRLAPVGAGLLIETLALVEAGTAPRTPQDEALATYAPPLDKAEAPLDFTKPAAVLSKQVCGQNPWPVAETMLFGKRLKVYGARKGGPTNLAPGTANGTPAGLSVACGDGELLILTDIQLEGGKRMSAGVFLNGRPVKELKL